jgi:ornithine carbamoyltransferase
MSMRDHQSKKGPPLLVKLGGAAIEPGEASARIADALVALHASEPGGIVLVHGGARALDELLSKLDLPITRAAGLRVTPDDQIDIVVGALAGIVNKHLVAMLTRAGARAAGVSLADGGLAAADRMPPVDGIDLGHVGVVTQGDPTIVRALLDDGMLPVISSIALDHDHHLVNVNADDAAAGLARTIGARALVFLTGAPGVLDATGATIASIEVDRVEALIDSGVITDGMVPEAAGSRTRRGGGRCTRHHHGLQPAAASLCGSPRRDGRGHGHSLRIQCTRATTNGTAFRMSRSTYAALSPPELSMSSTLEAKPSMTTSDLLTLADFDPSRIKAIFDLAAKVKSDISPYRDRLAGGAIVLLFEKDSLRTKVSFEVGIAKMGGHPIYHNHMDCRIGERESVADYARNLERWCDCIIARTYGHDVLEEMAEVSTVPIINALSEKYHPCQALTDLFTFAEHRGSFEGGKIAFVGDGNNVCHSLMLACAKLGVSTTVISPAGYKPDDDVVELATQFAGASGASVELTDDLGAVAGHDAIYTDAWVSMGFEAEAAQRHVAFAKYQVTAGIMREAGPQALFMHCLPAHRGFEVTAEVIDSEQSVVFDQAENRMHVQNAVLLELLGKAH